MRGRPSRFTQLQAIDALYKAEGLVGATASILHCDRHTIRRYIRSLTVICGEASLTWQQP